MPTLTIQPSDEDFYVYAGSATTNFTLDYLAVNNASGGNTRAILKFDFSALPASVVIDSATFSIYYYSDPIGDPAGRTFEVKRITQIAWVEAEATWNNYKSGSAWAAGGGDFSNLWLAQEIVPAIGNWMNFDVKTQVLIASQDVSKVAHFIVKDNIETGSSNAALFYSSRESTETTLRPKLVIEYRLISSISTAKPPKLYGGVKEAYMKDGWENKKYFFIEQPKAQPCVVQYFDLFVNTNNE